MGKYFSVEIEEEMRGGEKRVAHVHAYTHTHTHM